MVKYSKFDLLSGEPLRFNNDISVHKHKLSEIAKIGYDEFMGLTNLLVIDNETITASYKMMGISGEELPDPYDFLLLQSNNKVFFLKLQLAFITYIQRSIEIRDNQIVVKATKDKPEFVFDKSSFIDFQETIRLINCSSVLDEDEPEIITDNEVMKKKFEERREQLRQAKRKERAKEIEEGKGIGLADIISAICAFPSSSYTMLNVWDLTIYQLQNQFEILQSNENFTNKVILRSNPMADPKKLDLKYWIKQ